MKVKISNKQISFCSPGNYTKENFEQELKNIAFPNYIRFSNIKSALSNLANKFTQVINNLALCKTN